MAKLLTSRLIKPRYLLPVLNQQAGLKKEVPKRVESSVAVVLTGCGIYDGSELHEASAVLVHLCRQGLEPVIYAPDIQQLHVVNHLTAEPTKETRNALEESARIARGKVAGLELLMAVDHLGLVFPGGFGVAKNLSNFAIDGPNCKIIPEVQRIIKEFHEARKPIGFLCIAPILAARLIPDVEITLGQDKDDAGGMWPYAAAVAAAESWGATHRNKRIDEVCIDRKNRIVTAPAFMYNTRQFHKVFDNVGLLVNGLIKLMNDKD